MSSWKTTAAGIVLALGLIFTQIGTLLDEDPNTALDTNVLFGAFASIAGAIGVGFFARDEDK